jgi:hypothetical protein
MLHTIVLVQCFYAAVCVALLLWRVVFLPAKKEEWKTLRKNSFFMINETLQ